MKSSICPGSYAGRKGGSWSTAAVRRPPPAPEWRGSGAGWWGTPEPIARAGSDSGRARSGVSRWSRTGWTWGRDCGYRRSTAAGEEKRKNTVRRWHFLTSPFTALWYHLLPAATAWLLFLNFYNLFSAFQPKQNDLPTRAKTVSPPLFESTDLQLWICNIFTFLKCYCTTVNHTSITDTLHITTI